MILIPSWKRFKSWSMPNRFAYVVGVFTIIGVIFTIVVLFLGNDKPITNNNSFNTTNIDNSITNNIVKDTITVIDQKGFSIKGTTSSKLINSLRRKIVINDKAKNAIIFYYSNNILRLNDKSDTYIYNGGFIKVNISNNCYLDFKELKIPSLRPNSKRLIEIEIGKIINGHIDRNNDMISRKILQCV